jgi:hypothetical protein
MGISRALIFWSIFTLRGYATHPLPSNVPRESRRNRSGAQTEPTRRHLPSRTGGNFNLSVLIVNRFPTASCISRRSWLSAAESPSCWSRRNIADSASATRSQVASRPFLVIYLGTQLATPNLAGQSYAFPTAKRPQDWQSNL